MNFSLIVGIGIVVVIVAVLVLRKLIAKPGLPELETTEPQESAPVHEGSETDTAPSVEEVVPEDALAEAVAQEPVVEEPDRVVEDAVEVEEDVAVEPEAQVAVMEEQDAAVPAAEVEPAAEPVIQEAEVEPEPDPMAEAVPAASDVEQLAATEAPEDFDREPSLDEIEAMVLEATGDEPVAVEDEVVPIEFDEGVVPGDTAVEAEAELPPAEEEAKEPVAADADEARTASAVAAIEMSLEEYGRRLNTMEEERRKAVGESTGGSQEGQLELVVVNERLAQLADSYEEEISRRSGALDALDRLQGTVDAAMLDEAVQGVRTGNTEAAERLFDSLGDDSGLPPGKAAFRSGQLAECRVDLNRAMERYSQAVEQDKGNADYLGAAGITARRLYRYKEAVAWLESHVSKVQEERPESEELARGLRELAYTYVISGQYKKAGPLYKQSMTMLSGLYGPEHPEMATSWFQIGELQETLGEYDKAVSLYKQALSILEKTRGKDHPSLVAVLDKLARLCTELEMERESIPLYEQLVAIREKALKPTHPLLAISYNNLAESYRLQGQYDLAENCYKRCLEINEVVQGKEHPAVGAVLQELAKLCTSQKKHEEAEQYQKRATAIFDRTIELAEQKSGSGSLTLD